MAFLTAEQLDGWMDYAGREPFGFPMDDLRIASLLSMIGNTTGPKPPLETSQFLMGPNLVDPPNEDGTPSENALIRKLKQMLLPPKPKPPPEGD